MKTLFFLILSIVLVLSCKVKYLQKNKEVNVVETKYVIDSSLVLINKPICEELKKQVSANWIYVEKQNYYQVLNKFDTEISTMYNDKCKYKECLIGLTHNELIALLGKYSAKRNENEYWYYLSSSCGDVLGRNKKMGVQCNYLIVYMKNNVVSDILCCESIMYNQ